MSLEDFIGEGKAQLKAKCDVKAAFRDVCDGMKPKVEAIVNAREAGKTVVPELSYADIREGNVSAQARQAVLEAGCAIVRGVFPRKQAEAWNEEVGTYIEANDYVAKSKEKAGLDQYFSDLDAGAPQIFGLYWSRPQVMARQAESMAQTKQFMNRLWSVDGPMGAEFDPDFGQFCMLY